MLLVHLTQCLNSMSMLNKATKGKIIIFRHWIEPQLFYWILIEGGSVAKTNKSIDSARICLASGTPFTQNWDPLEQATHNWILKKDDTKTSLGIVCNRQHQLVQQDSSQIWFWNCEEVLKKKSFRIGKSFLSDYRQERKQEASSESAVSTQNSLPLPLNFQTHSTFLLF